MQSVPTINEIKEKVAEAAFGRQLVTNVLRGQVVEAIIACVLEPHWTWCAADYSSWDFERADGLRLEVKQSAARQSWATSDKPSACSFDIANRQGRWEGAAWVEALGRAAHVYIFGHHPIADVSADHRCANQWQFYVVPTHQLPATQRIGLRDVQRLSSAISLLGLPLAVEEAANRALSFKTP